MIIKLERVQLSLSKHEYELFQYPIPPNFPKIFQNFISNSITMNRYIDNINTHNSVSGFLKVITQMHQKSGLDKILPILKNFDSKVT